MSGRVQEIQHILSPDDLAAELTNKYVTYNNWRRPWLEEKKELRNYIFATDTRKTTNRNLPWKNSTTIPKICQIRDNLHANYLAAIFPNDDWFKWEGYDENSATKDKREAIEAYMKNKVRESGFRNTVSQLLYDYIDYGNAFADVSFVNESKIDAETGEVIDGYIGPKAVRISPMDLVFNPTAPSFEKSPKFTRYIKTIGELKLELDENPDLQYNAEVIAKLEKVRHELGKYGAEDINKIDAYLIDGFGSLSEYYQSGYVEIIEFEGSINDHYTGKFLKDYIITIVDRRWIVRSIPNPSWYGSSAKVHAGWRPRPDNLYAMGPLDNLVGMQYRIDHLENLKADALDLAVLPPLGIVGNVEEFEWGPDARILLGDEGQIIELGKNLNGVMASANEINAYEFRMEQMAGAPREAMGIRTPGEKTAFEVNQLQNAAGRIFQDRVRTFEMLIIEPLLNRMFEIARRYMDGMDVLRTIDDDLGVVAFLEITKEDITAKGHLRPVGARHFAAQAQLMQNLNGIFTSAIGQMIAPHVSSTRMASLVEELFGFEKYDLFEENVAIDEQAKTQRLMNATQEQVALEDMTPVDEEVEGQL